MRKFKEVRKMAVIAVLASVLTAVPLAYQAYAESNPEGETVVLEEEAPDPTTTGYLKVVKNVVNDNGGDKNYAYFNFNVTGGEVNENFAFDADSADVDGLDGVKLVPLEFGTYTITEPQETVEGYTVSYEGCDAVVITAENTEENPAVCTVTNDDVVPEEEPEPTPTPPVVDEDTAVVDIMDAIRIATEAHDELTDPSAVIMAQVKLEQFEGDAIAYRVVFADGWRVFIRASDGEILSLIDASAKKHYAGNRGWGAVKSWQNAYQGYWGHKPDHNNYQKPKDHHDKKQTRNYNGYTWGQNWNR